MKQHLRMAYGTAGVYDGTDFSDRAEQIEKTKELLKHVGYMIAVIASYSVVLYLTATASINL
jgi:hypothetical protein